MYNTTMYYINLFGSLILKNSLISIFMNFEKIYTHTHTHIHIKTHALYRFCIFPSNLHYSFPDGFNFCMMLHVLDMIEYLYRVMCFYLL